MDWIPIGLTFVVVGFVATTVYAYLHRSPDEPISKEPTPEEEAALEVEEICRPTGGRL